MRKNKGITLIALVITIIVLLILAGVAISTLGGENGLIAKAKNATEKWNEAGQNELDRINDLYSQIQVATGSTVTLSVEDLKTLVDSMVEEKMPKVKYVSGTLENISVPVATWGSTTINQSSLVGDVSLVNGNSLIAPVEGLYSIFYSQGSLASAVGKVMSRIMVNGVCVARSSDAGNTKTGSGTDTSSSVTAVVWLKAGDTVEYTFWSAESNSLSTKVSFTMAYLGGEIE